MKKVKNKPSSIGKKKTSETKVKSDKKAVKVKAPAKSKAPKVKPAAKAVAPKKRSKEFARRPVLRTPVPSPLPQQHVAAPQPTIVAPAHSMPPREEVIIPFAPLRPAMPLPTDFEVGGVTFRNAICYEATSEKMYEGQPKYMIAISNNAWFVPSLEPVIQEMIIRHLSKKYGTAVFHSVNKSRTSITNLRVFLSDLLFD